MINFKVRYFYAMFGIDCLQRHEWPHNRKMPRTYPGLRSLSRKHRYRLKAVLFSEVLSQLHKFPQLQQLQSLRHGIYGLMLQRPREIMRHEHGIDARRQRRINI